MRDQLKETLGPIELADLRPHLTRGAVITVSRELDLLDVGEALARDDKAQVEAWLEKGLIGKPTLQQLERWSKAEGPIGLSLVVAPFVLLHEEPTSTN